MKKPRLIAECGKEHMGDIEKAKQMIREAAKCGFDAVKFQAYSLDDIKKDHPNYTRYRKCWFSLDQLIELKKYSVDFKVDCYCSVFSKSMIRPLSSIFNEIKVPSTFFSQEKFVKECINRFKTVHISTGMHSLEDIKKYYKKYFIYLHSETKDKDLVFYHCTSQYPSLWSTARLERFKSDYPFYTAFSDHSIGTRQAVVAWLLGAKTIEKHFSIRADAPGWCVSPEDMKALHTSLEHMQVGLGDSDLTEEENNNFKYFKKEYKDLEDK